MKKGLLLVNLGTPSSLAISDVRTFLRKFLADKRVIQLPSLLRFALLHAFILPFRSRRSQQAYKAIWTTEGSPLSVYSLKLETAVQQQLGHDYQVTLGMRYGEPSLENALTSLKACSDIVIFPLYPQYSSASTGSALEAVMQIISHWINIPRLHFIQDFYSLPGFIQAQAELIKQHLDHQEMVLFSYHGIPESHIKQMGCQSMCKEPCPPPEAKITCYRSQCYETSHLLAQALHLAPYQYITAFQSRLGKAPWIQPYTDNILEELATRSIKRVLVVCPSFVTDCLETLEEIGIRGKEQWKALGGTELTVVPCLNYSPSWVKTICELAHSYTD